MSSVMDPRVRRRRISLGRMEERGITECGMIIVVCSSKSVQVFMYFI